MENKIDRKGVFLKNTDGTLENELQDFYKEIVKS